MKRILETLTLDRAEALIRQAVTGDRELFQALLTPGPRASFHDSRKAVLPVCSPARPLARQAALPVRAWPNLPGRAYRAEPGRADNAGAELIWLASLRKSGRHELTKTL